MGDPNRTGSRGLGRRYIPAFPALPAPKGGDGHACDRSSLSFRIPSGTDGLEALTSERFFVF
jgi:hypothetical protein